MHKLLSYGTLVKRSTKSSYINRKILFLNERTVKYLGLQNLCFVEKKKVLEWSMEYTTNLLFSVFTWPVLKGIKTLHVSRVSIFFSGKPQYQLYQIFDIDIGPPLQKKKKIVARLEQFFPTEASYAHSKSKFHCFSTVSVNHLENTKINHYFWQLFYDTLDCLHASEKVWLFENTVKTTLIWTTVPMLNFVKNYFLGLLFYILKGVVKHVINANWRGYKLCALSAIHALKQSRSLLLKLPLWWFITFKNQTILVLLTLYNIFSWKNVLTSCIGFFTWSFCDDVMLINILYQSAWESTYQGSN